MKETLLSITRRRHKTASGQEQQCNAGRDATADFITAVSVNNGLKEEAKNVELFKWLAANNPAAAKQVYPVAEKDEF